MQIENLITDVAETLRAADRFSSVPVLEEDKGDMAKELEAKIAKASVAAVVCWNGFVPRLPSDGSYTTPLGDVTVVISIFERPVVNRAHPGAPTLLELARRAATTLDGAASEGMDDHLHLASISPIAELRPGYISCDVEFKTKATL